MQKVRKVACRLQKVTKIRGAEQGLAAGGAEMRISALMSKNQYFSGIYENDGKYVK